MGLSLIPTEITFEGYARVFRNQFIIAGFKNTIVRVILGSALTITATIMTAYPLSKKYFPNRNFWTGFVIFTMFFSGGLIPSYILVRSLGLMNTVWALTIPGLISTYSMIIMRNFFMSIPVEMEESARIDGANDFSILVRIIVPVSGPIIATVLLWTMVGHWNAWFDSLIYISSPLKHVVMQILRRIVMEGTVMLMEQTNFSQATDTYSVNLDALKAATTMVVSLPIILVYPFLQKYFVKGIMIGSLKG
jgi:putative aldouronate transport system permease protein